MSFATATIQGYVTWIGELKQTPNGRFVVNLMVAVPDKTKTKSTTYKLSVWDLQTGSVLKYLKKNQLVTAQGALGLETYGDNPMIRLDFASILNYGYTPEEQTKEEKDDINRSGGLNKNEDEKNNQNGPMDGSLNNQNYHQAHRPSHQLNEDRGDQRPYSTHVGQNENRCFCPN